MRGIQVIGIFVIVYLIVQTLMQYKKGNYGIRQTCFWLALWVVIGVLFAFPSLVELTLPIFTMQDMMLTTLVAGLIVLFILVYHAYQQLARIERKFAELVQNLAIYDYVKEANNQGEVDEE